MISCTRVPRSYHERLAMGAAEVKGIASMKWAKSKLELENRCMGVYASACSRLTSWHMSHVLLSNMVHHT
jgi:hypothetical protein